jgi:hypothetical protein
MARISSKTLFKFTKDIDRLIDNLENGFYCHNTYEKLPLKNNGYRVPMACFCDIPLSLINNHFNWYGKYGIGINREYARKQGVKPVWYVTSESDLISNLLKNKNLSDYEVNHLIPYLKQYYGYQEKDGVNKSKKFYDEREWRYIPNKAKVEVFFHKTKSEIPDAIQNKERMKLDLNQIEYIIVEKKSDLKIIFEAVKKVSASKSIEPESLISKIMTAEQIKKDF